MTQGTSRHGGVTIPNPPGQEPEGRHLQVQHMFTLPYLMTTKCGLRMKPRKDAAGLPWCMLCYPHRGHGDS